jgi:hypothetical protein
MSSAGIHDFETILEAGFETRDSPFASNAASGEGKPAFPARALRHPRAPLAFA